jgi:hypothetical protein
VKHQLSVEANQRGAKVYVNGAYVGVTPYFGAFEQGNYTVTVRSDGYDEYVSSIRLNGAGRIYAVLNSRLFPVYIDAYNAPGASIYRDSIFIGTTPYRGSWTPGTYDLRISAPGFYDYKDQFTPREAMTLSIALQPALVEYEFKVPENFAANSGKPTRFEDLLVIVDGAQLTSPFGTMLPGSHHLEIYFGSFHLETIFDVPQGGRFVIEPFLGVNVH